MTDGGIELIAFFDETGPRDFECLDSRARLFLLLAGLPDLGLRLFRAAVQIGSLLAENREFPSHRRSPLVQNGELRLQSGEIALQHVGFCAQLFAAAAAGLA